MKRALATSLILSTCWAGTVSAQQADSNAALLAEIAELRARLDQLEAMAEDNAAATAEVSEQVDRQIAEVTQVSAQESLADRIEFSGDLRYRHETIDDAILPAPRNRQRIRARFRVDAQAAENVAVNLTLATGAANPVSANQTLGGGFARKTFGVDRAFFDWTVSDSLNVLGGKMANPMHRAGGHHLVFDSDLNPEGLAMAYDSGRVFANVGAFWAAERSGPSDDSFLTALQAGFGSMAGPAELTFGASYYDYSNTQGNSPFFLGIGAGNSLDPDGNFLYEYTTVELFAEARMEVAGHPLRLFVDAVENLEVDQFNKGYAIGGRWRSVSNPGDWEVRWAYQDLEADAVIAIFSDSDFGGGGTDAKGHVFRGTYVLKNSINLSGTYFMNERGFAAGNVRDYDRLQLDANFRF